MLDNLLKDLMRINERAMEAYKVDGNGFDKLDKLEDLFMLENLWSPSSELNSVVYTASMNSSVIKIILILIEELKDLKEGYEHCIEDYVNIIKIEGLNNSLRQVSGLTAFIIRFVFKGRTKTIKRVGYDTNILIYLKEVVAECNPIINSLDGYKHLIDILLERGYDLEDIYLRSDNLDVDILKDIIANKQNLTDIEYNENYDTYIEEDE